jgi:hypothetical protein
MWTLMALSEEKETNTSYLSEMQLISSSGTTDCKQEYIQLSRMSTVAERF